MPPRVPVWFVSTLGVSTTALVTELNRIQSIGGTVVNVIMVPRLASPWDEGGKMIGWYVVYKI